MFTLSPAPREVIRTLPSLESLQRLFDQPLSPGLRPRPQVPGEANPINMVSKLSQLTSLLSSIEDKVKALLHEGPESPHRRSLIPPVTFEVKAESLGIPQKMQLKVDVESGKLIIKKSKDGSEDKFYSHKKIPFRKAKPTGKERMGEQQHSESRKGDG
ncbi:INPP5D isoform 11 [Pan troglodytes]|uniref:INPP5D isoform 11 n=1 Tax=Pan troglodytes TaxID=9598 RepID=A0A2J8NER7_PANTR|nr:INPP5D isoform 11 [Pan troglodytes]